MGAVERALSILWDARRSRSRVVEWPVTDPVSRYWYGLKITRRPSQLPECARENGAGAGRFDRTRPAASPSAFGQSLRLDARHLHQPAHPLVILADQLAEILGCKVLGEAIAAYSSSMTLRIAVLRSSTLASALTRAPFRAAG